MFKIQWWLRCTYDFLPLISIQIGGGETSKQKSAVSGDMNNEIQGYWALGPQTGVSWSNEEIMKASWRQYLLARGLKCQHELTKQTGMESIPGERNSVSRLCGTFMRRKQMFSGCTLWVFCRLKVSVLGKSIYWILNAQCDSVWRRPLWEVIKFRWNHNGGASMMGLGPLEEDDETRVSSLFMPFEETARRWQPSGQEEASYQSLAMLAHSSCISSLQNCEKWMLVV